MIVRPYSENGEITVFLSLLLSSLLALLSISYESARVQFIKLEKETAMDASLRSCFGEYNKDLYDIYDLLYIDCAYKVADSSIGNVIDHLDYYYRKNIDPGEGQKSADVLGVQIRNTELQTALFASDDKGYPVYFQIVENMEKYGDISHGRVLGALADGMPNYDADSILGKWDDALSRVASFGISFTNPAEIVRAMAGDGADQVINAKGQRLSSVSYSDLPSRRRLQKGNYGTLAVSERDLIFNEYLLQKCSSCVNRKEYSVLSCELEYILYGKTTDYDNLKLLTERLIRIIAKENYGYACSDGGMQEEMRALAEAVVPECHESEPGAEGWFDRELLIDAVVDSLECAWAQTEAICKVSRLLSGGRVDIHRPYDNRIVSVGAICEYMAGLNSSGGNGNTYEEYIGAFLSKVSRIHKTERLLDVIEMNMRFLGNPGLSVDGCIEYMKVKVETESLFGYSYNITRDYSYEKKYRSEVNK